MRIILEGPDNAGKTTLAHNLVNLSPRMRYFHAGGRPPTYVDEVECVLDQIYTLTLPDVILDRITPISQQVYNPDPLIDPTRRAQLETVMAKQPLLVYCRPSTDHLMRKHEFTWRSDESEEHKQKIITSQHLFIDRYDRIMTELPHISYDFSDESAGVVLKYLVAACNGDETAHGWLYSIRTPGGARCES